LNDDDIRIISAGLREYDPDHPRCRTIVHTPVHETDGFDDPYETYREDTCVRPKGHDGGCRTSRPVMGWPGYRRIAALLESYLTLRDEHAEQARLLGMSSEREARLLARISELERGQHLS